MKKIFVMAGFLFFVFGLPAYGDQANAPMAAADELTAAGIEIAKHDDSTLFTFSVTSGQNREVPIAAILANYYFGEGGFREVILSCFLPLETAFPSDQYDVAAGQVYEIYEELLGQGVSENDVFISVRFEKNIEADGMITVEFLKHANYFERVGKNFVTGITDIVSSPMELPMGMVTESRKSGAMTGVPKGVFSGFGQAVRKAGTGVITLLTFWAG